MLLLNTAPPQKGAQWRVTDPEEGSTFGCWAFNVFPTAQRQSPACAWRGQWGTHTCDWERGTGSIHEGVETCGSLKVSSSFLSILHPQATTAFGLRSFCFLPGSLPKLLIGFPVCKFIVSSGLTAVNQRSLPPIQCQQGPQSGGGKKKHSSQVSSLGHFGNTGSTGN